jgi:GNAT superfamily N-acetyltransferase
MIEQWDGQRDLRPLVEQWVKECVPGDYDIDKCLQDVKDLNDAGAVLLLVEDGEVVGGLALSVLDMFFSDKTYAAVRYWYILPRYRSLAKRLIRGAKEWAKDCDYLLICSSRLCHPAKDFYELMGFTEFETVYIGEI